MSPEVEAFRQVMLTVMMAVGAFAATGVGSVPATTVATSAYSSRWARLATCSPAAQA